MSIRTAYTVLLAPLSPYRGTPNMPNWGLWHRVNDDARHGIPRIACMAVWAPLGALFVGGLAVVDWTLHRHSGLSLLAGAAIALMFAWKMIDTVIGPKYKPDPLDWLCDAGSWGTAGAYTAAALLAHAPLDWRVYAVLTVLWLISYPFSTPR
jgi:hypothetical protein